VHLLGAAKTLTPNLIELAQPPYYLQTIYAKLNLLFK
jgi:hypothetical protein